MGLEPMTSPLPRECSTTELHQPYCKIQKLKSAKTFLLNNPTATAAIRALRERQKILKAKMSANDNSPAPSSARPESPELREPSALQPIFRCRQGRSPQPLPCLYNQTSSYIKLSGAQGRIRTSVARCAADLQSAAINHSATCAHLLPCPLPHKTSATHHDSPSISRPGSSLLP